MDPGGDAAGEVEIGGVAIDNKVTEDVAMDTAGDSNVANKDNDHLNGDGGEQDNVTGTKQPEASIEDSGFEQFAPLTALSNGEDAENIDINQDSEMASHEADNTDEQAEDTKTAEDEHDDHDVTAASFVTALDHTLPSNITGVMNETTEDTESDGQQDKTDEGLFHTAESLSSPLLEPKEMDQREQETEDLAGEVDAVEVPNDVDDVSQDSLVAEPTPELEEDGNTQDSLSREIERELKADNTIENVDDVDDTTDSQQKQAENDSNDLQEPEAEQLNPEIEEINNDSQDSCHHDRNLDLNESSSPKENSEFKGIGDADDSNISDFQPILETGEMESMENLCDDEENNKTVDTKEVEDLNESGEIGEKRTEENHRHEENNEAGAQHDESVIDAYDEGTSEPIITGVMSLEGIDFDENKTEQMEVDDAVDKTEEENKEHPGGEGEIAIEKHLEGEPDGTNTASLQSDQTADTDQTAATGEENKTAGRQNDESLVDENKLLQDTEEDRKADEEEAMETDEPEPISQQNNADGETSPDKSIEKAVHDADMSAEQMEEPADHNEKPREGSPVITEGSDKPKDVEQKAPDETEKSIDENKKSKDEAESADKETEESKQLSEDVMKKKVKQERLDDQEKTEEDSTMDDESKGPKIVGVTSAVGIDDVKPAAVTKKRSSGESKKSSGAASPVVIDDEDDKAKVLKEEKPVRATRSSAAKKEEKPKPIKKEVDEKDDDVIAIKEEKKPAPKPKSSSKIQKCIVCLKTGKCKYNIVRNGDVKHLCDDVCFKKFRSNPTEYLRAAPAVKTDTKTTPAAQPTPNQQKPAQKQAAGGPPPVYKTCSVCQLMNVRTSKPFLNWQGLDFCGEECLGKFQGNLSATCSYCASQINQVNRAKFCWRVGTEVKQFCSSPCYTEFIKRLKLCAFCNKDLANMRDSFMAPVGNQGTFKDFCSQVCLAKYEERNAKDIQIVGVEKGQQSSVPPKGNFQCQVCGKTGPVKHEIKLEGKQNRLCSDPCLSAFQYANKLTMNTCDNCGTNCYNENLSPQYIQYEGQQKRFCSYMCVNSFKNFNKKTVPCAWCGAKKSNFDMIERVDANNKYQLFCSLNCLSLYRVNLQATSNQAVVCDQCRKYVPAQYHLTMSDASVRNFCSYTCVMQFQQQFQTPKHGTPQSTNQARQQQQPPQQQNQAGLTTRSKAVYNTRGTGGQQKQTTPPPPKQTARQIAAAQKKASNNATIPIISNVVSLAPQGNQQQINVKSSSPVVVQGAPEGIKTTTTTTGGQTVQQQIIIQPPPPKTVKNKSLLCKPYVQTKATSCKPHTQTKEVQTEGKPEPEKYLIPVPIPIYIPTPLAMYSTPTPVMVPVPLPVPVPVFIPTTKKSSASILKQIKEIQEKIPNDPLEAEMLMMAEALGGKDDDSSSESEDELPAALPPPVKQEVPASSTQELGEDMLQMALRMASEMSDEPVMDLENSLEPVAVNTVAPTPPSNKSPSPQIKDEEYDTDEYIPPSARTRRSTGARKRSTSARRTRAKRQKIEAEPETPAREATPSPQPQAPPPDANFHLKYTYGVNAWKHWVIAKNAQLEAASKTNKKLKLFKTDLLQCTADELNYALCLFVKEVRKPNGEEYAVDSIYYLCLGIQQYLFENGRIDNIFTDNYFERFTDFLNEVLTMYEPKLNTAGQLVCRIEEEHLWESKQLGAHSPHVLLNSLVYFNTKYFMLKTSEDHLKLSFTHIMKHWKKTAGGKGSGTGPNVGRSVYLRYYCPSLQGKSDPNQKKRKEEMPVYEQTENLENPLRCPVKLYEFYLSKCPESIKNRNDTFYLVPERSCVPDSPVWYSTQTLGIDHMAKMLNRIRLVREIQEAHLHTQPIYI